MKKMVACWVLLTFFASGYCQKTGTSWINGWISPGAGDTIFGHIEQTRDHQQIRFYYSPKMSALLGPGQILSYCYLGHLPIISYYAESGSQERQLEEWGYSNPVFISTLVRGPAINLYAPVGGGMTTAYITEYGMPSRMANLYPDKYTPCNCDLDGIYGYLQGLNIYDSLERDFKKLKFLGFQERIRFYRKINEVYRRANALSPDHLRPPSLNDFYLTVETGWIRLSKQPIKSEIVKIAPKFGNITRIGFGISYPSWKTSPIGDYSSEINLSTCLYQGHQTLGYHDLQGTQVYAASAYYKVRVTSIGYSQTVSWYPYRHVLTGIYLSAKAGFNYSWYNSSDAVIKVKDSSASPDGKPLNISRTWLEFRLMLGIRTNNHLDFFIGTGIFHSYTEDELGKSLNYFGGVRYHL